MKKLYPVIISALIIGCILIYAFMLQKQLHEPLAYVGWLYSLFGIIGISMLLYFIIWILVLIWGSPSSKQFYTRGFLSYAGLWLLLIGATYTYNKVSNKLAHRKYQRVKEDALAQRTTAYLKVLGITSYKPDESGFRFEISDPGSDAYTLMISDVNLLILEGWQAGIDSSRLLQKAMYFAAKFYDTTSYSRVEQAIAANDIYLMDEAGHFSLTVFDERKNVLLSISKEFDRLMIQLKEDCLKVKTR
jgi:hypothetical protein